jgi:hypothetical protein
MKTCQILLPHLKRNMELRPNSPNQIELLSILFELNQSQHTLLPFIDLY